MFYDGLQVRQAFVYFDWNKLSHNKGHNYFNQNLLWILVSLLLELTSTLSNSLFALNAKLNYPQQVENRMLWYFLTCTYSLLEAVYTQSVNFEICLWHIRKKIWRILYCSSFRQTTAHMISGPAHPTGSHGVVKVIDLQCDGWEEHVEQCTYISSGGCSRVGAHVQCFG